MQSNAQQEIASTFESDADDSAVQRVLEDHHGNACAAIATLLSDCGHLRRQLALASRMMGYGFSRGWVPTPDRIAGAPPDAGASD